MGSCLSYHHYTLGSSSSPRGAAGAGRGSWEDWFWSIFDADYYHDDEYPQDILNNHRRKPVSADDKFLFEWSEFNTEWRSFVTQFKRLNLHGGKRFSDDDNHSWGVLSAIVCCIILGLLVMVLMKVIESTPEGFFRDSLQTLWGYVNATTQHIKIYFSEIRESIEFRTWTWRRRSDVTYRSRSLQLQYTKWLTMNSLRDKFARMRIFQVQYHESHEFRTWAFSVPTELQSTVVTKWKEGDLITDSRGSSSVQIVVGILDAHAFNGVRDLHALRVPGTVDPDEVKVWWEPSNGGEQKFDDCLLYIRVPNRVREVILPISVTAIPSPMPVSL